jgi:chromosome segregation ATPase
MKTLSLLLAMMALATSPSWAANDSREKQLLRRMQQQVQQLDQARALAEQEKATALADMENLQRELNKLKAVKRQLTSERLARKRVERELKALQTVLEASKTRMAETEAKLADSQAQQRATAHTLAQTESAKKQTETQLAGTRQDLKQCQTHNGRLYGLGREMMQKYRDKSCQDALAQAEPFTGLKKVEVENLLETWRDQLDREKLSTAVKP